MGVGSIGPADAEEAGEVPAVTKVSAHLDQKPVFQSTITITAAAICALLVAQDGMLVSDAGQNLDVGVVLDGAASSADVCAGDRSGSARKELEIEARVVRGGGGQVRSSSRRWHGSTHAVVTGLVAIGGGIIHKVVAFAVVAKDCRNSTSAAAAGGGAAARVACVSLIVLLMVIAMHSRQ